MMLEYIVFLFSFVYDGYAGQCVYGGHVRQFMYGECAGREQEPGG